jgi:CTP-dependent riboflavin kinase
VDDIRLTGTLVSGQGVAQSFTRAPWARAAFMQAVGIDPFPGTLNLKIAEGPSRAAWVTARAKRGILMPAPDASFCDGRLFRATLWALAGQYPTGRSIAGAVVVPMVPKYPEEQLEIIAAVALRDALGVRDGDELVVQVNLSI